MAGPAKAILAGYDGSPDSELALDWAVTEAQARLLDLIVCHAWQARYQGLSEGSPDDEAARQHAERILAGGLRRARTAIEADSVQPLLVNGSAAQVLCDQSAGAAMVVVGSRGRGGLARLLTGSVSSQVAAYASGPVTVVRGRSRPVPGHQPGPVVVGVDGSEACQAAVTFAFEEAALREVPLHAICALADAAGLLGGAHQVEEDFDKTLAGYEAAFPEVTVHRIISPGSPRRALLDATAQAHAQLLVVGARGREGLKGMALGSVSHAVLNHAPCPVSVVHPR